MTGGGGRQTLLSHQNMPACLYAQRYVSRETKTAPWHAVRETIDNTVLPPIRSRCSIGRAFRTCHISSSHLRITQFGWTMTGATSRLADAGVAFPSMSSLEVRTERTAMATFQEFRGTKSAQWVGGCNEENRLMHQKPEARAQ